MPAGAGAHAASSLELLLSSLITLLTPPPHLADPPGFDRTKYGLKPGQGRGAPEIDMVEVKCVLCMLCPLCAHAVPC